MRESTARSATRNGLTSLTLLIVALAQSLPVVPANAAAARPAHRKAQIAAGEQGLAPKALPAKVQAVIDAYGGADALRQHREHPMEAHGTISSTSGISEAANSFNCDILQQGEKARVTITMLGAPMIRVFDGKNGWTQYGDWVAPATHSSTQMMAEELKHGLPALVNALAPTSQIEVMPSQAVHGVLCDVFKVTTGDGTCDTFFADPTSHLIRRADYLGTDHELATKTRQSVEYSDYRPVAGSLEPFTIVWYSDGRQRGETKLTAIDDTVKTDDNTFAMPPESEIARLKQAPVAIPFEYIGNHIVVQASINNGPPANFIVDTGASQTVLDEETAATLGPHPTSTVSITAGSRAVPLSYTRVSTLDIGPLSLDDIPVFIKDLSDMADHPAGLIGGNVLRRFLVTIDFEEKKLILADPRSSAVPPGATVVPTISAFGGTALMVRGKLDDKSEMNFLVDTGAAFNNMPQSMAKPLYTGHVLPVGVIFGLDGQKIHIGSLKLQNLQLGGTKIANPVFTLTPEGALPAGGLFNATAMGILGNPIWSQFQTTIDYRNERLVLEAQPGKEKLKQFFNQIDATQKEYLRTKDIDAGLKAFQAIANAAEGQQIKAAQAIALCYVASCHADKFAASKDSHWLDVAGKEYERADKVANDSRDRTIQGRVLALWALMYLNSPRSMNDITAAEALVSKALKKAPMESNIFAAFGATMMQAGKHSEAEKLLDRALVLDPSNWQALWATYRLYGEENRSRDQALILAQLQHYYPAYPDVLAAANAKQ